MLANAVVSVLFIAPMENSGMDDAMLLCGRNTVPLLSRHWMLDVFKCTSTMRKLPAGTTTQFSVPPLPPLATRVWHLAKARESSVVLSPVAPQSVTRLRHSSSFGVGDDAVAVAALVERTANAKHSVANAAVGELWLCWRILLEEEVSSQRSSP